MAFVFLLGTGRCGSSLVQELVARHPDVGFVSNVDDRLGGRLLGRANNVLYARLPGRWTRKGRLRFAPSEGYRALERLVAPSVVRPGRSLDEGDAEPWLVDRLHDFFSVRAAAQRRSVFLHKFTGWPRAGLLATALPDVRFVNVIRDGRAVASSLVQMSWWGGAHDLSLRDALGVEDRRVLDACGWSDAVFAGLVWQRLVREHERQRDLLPDGCWLDVRYEDLLADPAATLTRVLDHAQLPTHRRFWSRVEHIRISSSRALAFRRDLSSRTLAVLDEALADTLTRSGYDV